MPNQHTGGSVRLEDLHRLLWVYSDDGILRMRQADVADDLRLSRQRITQMFAQLEERRVITKNSRYGSYLVVDPDDPLNPTPGDVDISDVLHPGRDS